MKLKYFIGISFMTLSSVALTGCSDDDDAAGSTMTISKVYLEDASETVTDREIDFARLGQLIRIEGSGFTGLKKIYVNGYDTYFNNALLTNSNIFVTLDGDTPIADAEESVRNTIQLVKDATSLSYPFTIRAASPSITSCDNTLPMAGETVIVYGSNLEETTKVTLPDGTEITSGIESDEDGTYYSFTMPNVSRVGGPITSEGANGTAMTPDYFNEFDAYIINWDEDGHGVQGSWSATFSADDLVDDPLGTGRGKVVQIIPQSTIDEGGVKAGVSNINGFWTAGNDEASDDWTRMITAGVIESTTPVSEVALQFDVYVPEEWDLTGQVEITLQNNLSNYGYGSSNTKYNADYPGYATVWVPWLNEDDGSHEAFTTGDRWQTITIPLTKFGFYTEEADNITFADVVSHRNSGSYRNFGILFSNADIEVEDAAGDVIATYPSSATSQLIYLDNFRIVPYAENTVSDFDD